MGEIIIKICSKCKIEKEERFFTTDKCRKDGLCPQCNECRKIHKKRSRERKKEKIKSYAKEYYKENQEHLKAYSKEYGRDYYEKNKEKCIRYQMEWRKKNKEKHNYYKCGTPQRRIRTNLSKIFQKSINKDGNSTSQITENYLGYKLKELYNHLESLFEDGMSWNNYGVGKGKWCIDHIIPQSSFSYSSYNDEDFKKCWSLSNLQPMWFDENSAKGNRGGG